MDNKITNINGISNSLQISKLGNVTAGNFKLTTVSPFLVKNITDDNIKASVRLANMSNFIETILYPGWNTELMVEI